MQARGIVADIYKTTCLQIVELHSEWVANYFLLAICTGFIYAELLALTPVWFALLI